MRFPKLNPLLLARWALLVITASVFCSCGAVRNTANRGLGILEGVSGRNISSRNDIPMVPSVPGHRRE